MAKDFSKQLWHGIPRTEIPWFPNLDPEKCIGCELCFLSCGRGVFDLAEIKPYKATAARPYNCMVGCSTCATVCPTEAITFPGRDLIYNTERQHKIFKLVHQEAADKKAANQQKQQASRQVAESKTRIKFEIAGQFGEKRFLQKLADAIREQPIDIVNLTLNVPTVMGLSENTPAFMQFELTSTTMEDIKPYRTNIIDLIQKNELVLVNEL